MSFNEGPMVAMQCHLIPYLPRLHDSMRRNPVRFGPCLTQTAQHSQQWIEPRIMNGNERTACCILHSVLLICGRRSSLFSHCLIRHTTTTTTKYVNVRGGIECFARVLWDAVVARPPRRLWFDIDSSWILMNLWIFFHYEKIILNSFSVFFLWMKQRQWGK